MDVEERSVWLRATPNNAVLAQPFYATEAGLFYGRSHFATARTDKESYILFYTLAGAGLIEQNEQHIELPQGAALLMNCRTPQSYCTAPAMMYGSTTGYTLTVLGLKRWPIPYSRRGGLPLRMSAAWRCSLCLKHCLPSGKRKPPPPRSKLG